jgi:hypothetical protein
MLDAAGHPIDDHQPAAAPDGGRLLRDQLIGQFEIEIGDARDVS